MLLCLSLRAFLLATKQLKVVGIPVVVKAKQIIKKLNNIWYIPRPISPIDLDKNILYKKPITLTIKLEINNTAVEKIRLGILNKSPPYV